MMSTQASRLTVSVVALIFLGLPMPSANAEDPCVNPLAKKACAVANDGAVRIGVSNRTPGRQGDSPTQGGRLAFTAEQMAVAFCADATANADAGGNTPQAVVEICRRCVGVGVASAPTREQVRRAFRELPLYRGQIRTDPGTLTLVNLETYVWCGDSAGRGCDVLGEGEQTVTLLGQPVRIRPRIVGYAWDFGDGQQSTGRRATHSYRHASTVTVTLTLTWTADYALAGGAFQPVDDTTTTTSPPRSLPVREAQAVIVR